MLITNRLILNNNFMKISIKNMIVVQFIKINLKTLISQIFR
jgi:hypothetical protein